MMKRRRTGQPLQIAAAVSLLVALAGCGSSYTLQDRIRDLEAQGYGTAQVQRPARSQTHPQRVKSRTRQADMESPEAGEPTRTARSTEEAGVVERQPRPQPRLRDGDVTSGESDPPAGRVARSRTAPAGDRRTPELDSPEWDREQAERDRVLDRKIRSICRSC